jgi:DNA ligase D-like protein (predicted 3'-phosphoesterase)
MRYQCSFLPEYDLLHYVQIFGAMVELEIEGQRVYVTHPYDSPELLSRLSGTLQGRLEQAGKQFSGAVIQKAGAEPPTDPQLYPSHITGPLKVRLDYGQSDEQVSKAASESQMEEDASMDSALRSAQVKLGTGLHLFATEQQGLEVANMFERWIDHQALPEDPQWIEWTYRLIGRGDARENWAKLAFFLRNFLKKPDITPDKAASILDEIKVAQKVAEMADPHSVMPGSPTQVLKRLGAMEFDAELEEYKYKREFGETPATFAVQRYRAHQSELHYNFRLVAGDTLKSWDVPKLPALLSDEFQHVSAFEAEDEPALDHKASEAPLPCGYRAGDSKVWDDGSYRTISQDDNHWKFRLQGRYMKGTFTFLRISGHNWNLRRAKDNAT